MVLKINSQDIYLRISKGSLCECVVCATIAKKHNYISNEQESDIRKKLMEISKMISGLLSKLSVPKTTNYELQTTN